MPRAGFPLQYQGVSAAGGPLSVGFGTEIEFSRETGPPNLADAAVAQLLDNAAAVNVGGGVVGLPLTGHLLVAGSWFLVVGTANYDGLYQLQAGGGVNQLNVIAAFVAEAFAGTETVTPQTVGERTVRRYTSLSVAIECPFASPEAIFFSFDNRQSWTQRTPGTSWGGQLRAHKMIVASVGGTGTYLVTVAGL